MPGGGGRIELDVSPRRKAYSGMQGSKVANPGIDHPGSCAESLRLEVTVLDLY